MERVVKTTEHEVEIREKRYILHLESNKMAEITLKDKYSVNYHSGHIRRDDTCEIYDKLSERFTDKLFCDNNEIVVVDKIIKTSLVEEDSYRDTIRIQEIERSILVPAKIKLFETTRKNTFFRRVHGDLERR